MTDSLTSVNTGQQKLSGPVCVEENPSNEEDLDFISVAERAKAFVTEKDRYRSTSPNCYNCKRQKKRLASIRILRAKEKESLMTLNQEE